MSDPESTPSEDTIDVLQLAKAIRLIAFAVVIGLSLLNVGIVRSIDNFDKIFHDMLGGVPLPLLTQLIIGGRLVVLAIAGAIPAVALGALLSRRVVAAIYVLSAAALIAIISTGVVYLALFAPLIEVIKAMGSAPA